MKFTPTEFCNNGKPKMNSRIWYCIKCIEHKESLCQEYENEHTDEAITEFHKILKSPELHIAIQHMFTKEYIDIHNKMAKHLMENPAAKHWKFSKCNQGLSKLLNEVPVQTFFTLATQKILELIIAIKHSDLYPELFEERKVK